jgi:ParB family chromosome partitioning protein
MQQTNREQRHIPLTDLKVAPLNVRKTGRRDDLSDLARSIATQGVLQPLLVRKNCEGFEIVAGQRRFLAAQMVDKETTGGIGSLPCLIMDDGDDAAAIEASLSENIARLPMDIFDQFDAFNKLVGAGRSAEDIAERFGVTPRFVEQRLALSRLLNGIKDAYRTEQIDAGTLQTLTRASRKQQSDWLALFNDPNERAPTGRMLKQWLHGDDIKTSVALFDLSTYSGEIIHDLFSEESVFADADHFIEAQRKAVEAEAAALREDGWQVVVMEYGQYFSDWEYVACPKGDGGQVYIEIKRDHSVQFHRGWITKAEAARRSREAQKAQAAATGETPPNTQPELTKVAQNYIGLMRHAAVQAALPAQSGIALRLAVAHMIAQPALWQVRSEPSRPERREIGEALADSTSRKDLRKTQETAARLAGIDLKPGCNLTDSGYGGHQAELAQVFAALLKLEDEEVLQVLAVTMAETLEAHTGLVEMLGELLGVNMAAQWQPNDLFFDLVRDREALLAMIREMSDKRTAEANATSPLKTLRAVIRHCLDGTGGRKKAADWFPRYMASWPMKPYTKRGRDLPALQDYQRIKRHFT